MCASFFCVLLALSRLDPRNEALLEAVLKRARFTRHPRLVACDANVSPSEEPDACGSSGKSFHVQVKKCEGRMD